MKIALVILNAEPTRGGAERYTYDLAKALFDRGMDVHLLATRFARNVEPAKQVRMEGAAGSRTGRYRAFIGSLDVHLSQTKYDVVHAMLPVPNCDLYHPHAGIEANNLEMGYLRHQGMIRQAVSRLTSRLNRKRRLYAGIERELLEQRHAPVLCLSNAMQQIAEHHYRLNEGQSHVLINGVDLTRYDPAVRADARDLVRGSYGIGSDDVVALLMANNYRLKGLRQAMATLQRLVEGGHRRAKLLVVGKESVEPYIALGKRLGIADHLIMAGPTTDAQSLYAACDLFVLPTAYDSCSLVVLESLAMGKPVITTRRNGAAEAMTDGVEGFVIEDQSDMEGLHEAWEALLNDDLRVKMAAAAIELRSHISWTAHVDRLVEVYARIRASATAEPN